MALLKLSGLITQISGKIGGSILATSVNGAYIKQNSYSQQHATSLQSKQRAKVGLSAQIWASVQSFQKDLWVAQIPNYPYTNKVGDVVFYTAYQLFNKINANRILIGLAPLMVPPVYVAPSVPSLFSVAISPNQLQYDIGNLKTTDTVVVYATPPQRGGTSYNNSKLRLLSYYNQTSNFISIDLSSIYIATFGNFAKPDAIYLGVKIIDRNTGISSDKTIPLLVQYAN